MTMLALLIDLIPEAGIAVALVVGIAVARRAARRRRTMRRVERMLW